MNKYSFTELHRFCSDDSTMMVFTVRADWRHGIYNTAEHEVLTVVVKADGLDLMIDRNGNSRYLDTTADDQFVDELVAFLTRLS